MKPLKLIFEAFESYYGRQEIDFSALSRDGVFLILGNTGSGKTAIFDALSYALFGVLSEPQRMEGKTMIKNDDADETHFCQVILEFEEKGKRYLVTRSPEQRVVSKRTTILKKNSVELAFLSENKTSLTGKAADLKIQEIIGLDDKQFFQVSMLAQGAFAQILTADTKNRAEILRKLFHTYIYKDFTDALTRKTNELENQYKNCMTSLDTIYHGISYASVEDYNRAESILDGKERIQFLQDLKEEYQKKEVSLASSYQASNERLTQLKLEKDNWLKMDRERRDNQNLSVAIVNQSQKNEQWEQQLLELTAKKGETEQWNNIRVTLTNQLEQYAKLDEYHSLYQQFTDCFHQQEKDLNELKIRYEEENRDVLRLGKELTDIEEELKQEVDYGKEIAQLQSSLAQLKKQESEFSSLKRTIPMVADYYEKQISATKKWEAAQALYQDYQKRYYSSIVGDLAKHLEDDQPCPVCGSIVHPHIASFTEDDISKEQCEEKKRESERTQQELSQISERLSALDATAKEQLSSLETFLSTYDSSLKKEGTYQERYRQCYQCYYTLLEKTENKKKLAEKTMEHFSSLHQQTEEKKKELESARNVIECLNREIQSCLQQKASSESQSKSYQEQYEEKKKSLTYASETEAKREIQKLQDDLDRYQRDVEACNKGLNQGKQTLESIKGQQKVLEERIKAYSGREEDVINGDYFSEQSKNTDLYASHGQMRTSLDSLTHGLQNYQQRESANQKMTEEYNRVKRLAFVFAANSRLKDGNDEERGLSIENYVLSYYLDRILERASQRLLRMSNGQYLLQRRISQEKGNSQSGLEIDVRSLLNEKVRDASSLSGGETFMASLSLALGLSDYVKESLGKTNIETLFIDEGFGTLDKERLDKVVAVISTLSSSEHTTIGLISHVAELVPYFSKQLLVEKDSLGHSQVKHD